MYGMLDISVSGMVAQRTRLDAVQANLANQNSIYRDASGNPVPYRRRITEFAPGDPSARTQIGRELGVHVRAIAFDPTPPKPGRYEPDHPDAYKTGPYKGHIATTNIQPVIENINALDAQRAYEANVMAAEATKQMIASALRLVA